MIKKKLSARPLMTSPVQLRRGTLVGEIRIYQELIKLAAEKTRIMQESRMWSQKGHGIEGQIKAIESYQSDLFARLNLTHSVSKCPEQKEHEVTEQKENQGRCSNGAMKLQF